MDKKCFKCGKVKDINEFYAHPQMSDGHLGKCKSCTKKDTSERYYSDSGIKKIIAYEKWRAKQPHRKEKRTEYQRKTRTNFPGHYRAHNLTQSAIKHGRLKQKPCEICGSIKSEAHHPDYRKWRTVRWLCRKHHMEAHGKRSWK